MHKFYKKIYQKLINAGFDCEAYKEDFIVIKSPFRIPIIKNYYVKFDKNRVLVFTMVDIIDILNSTYSNEDLAYALSQKVFSFDKEGITVSIKQDSLLLSSFIPIKFFTSVESLYHKIDNTMIKIQVTFAEIIQELEFNKKFKEIFYD